MEVKKFNMKFCQLIILSKNRNSITKFINICAKNKILTTILRFLKKKSRKKILTVLKSPHVNKTAQEQFEEKLILNCVNIKSQKINKFLIFLKKTFINYYPDLKILINFKIFKNQTNFITRTSTFSTLTYKIYEYKVINYRFFLINNNSTKFFNTNERLKMILNAKNNLKQLESYGLN
jgi:ribosomal protein S10